MRLLLILFSFVLMQCSMDDFVSYTKLDDLRIVALVVDQPELQVSSLPANVTLVPYVSDRDGGGTSFTVTVVTCSELASSQTTNSNGTCDNVADRIEVVSQTFDPSTDARTGTDPFPYATPFFTGALNDITITVPSGLTDGLEDSLVNNGIGYLIDVTVDNGSKVDRAIRNVLVSDRATVHTNPVIDSITFAGAAISGSMPRAEGDLLVTASSASTETYTYTNSIGQSEDRTETVFVSFLSDRATFNASKTLAGDTNLMVPPETEDYLIMAVVRDGRGGTTVQVIAE